LLDIGIDPKTGNKLFLTNNNQILHLLEICRCCGASDILSDASYTNMCNDCANHWRAYSSQKSRVDTTIAKDRVLQSFYKKVLFWCGREEAGYRAPTNIQERRIAIEQVLKYRQLERKRKLEHDLEIELAQEKPCKRCGQITITYQEAICRECEERYDRYKDLRRRVMTLTQEECVELRQVIREYIELDKWSPDTETVLLKLKTHENKDRSQ